MSVVIYKESLIRKGSLNFIISLEENYVNFEVNEIFLCFCKKKNL